MQSGQMGVPHAVHRSPVSTPGWRAHVTTSCVGDVDISALLSSAWGRFFPGLRRAREARARRPAIL
jgi:hypothetical protein